MFLCKSSFVHWPTWTVMDYLWISVILCLVSPFPKGSWKLASKSASSGGCLDFRLFPYVLLVSYWGQVKSELMPGQKRANVWVCSSVLECLLFLFPSQTENVLKNLSPLAQIIDSTIHWFYFVHFCGYLKPCLTSLLPLNFLFLF